MDTQSAQGTLQDPTSPPLYIAFELSQKQWKLGFTIGVGQRPRIRTIQARDLLALQFEVQEARRRFRLPDTVTILSCYEAGRDGFWLDRYLHAQGIINLVVDSASIEVSRRSKRAKTDKLDVDKLLEMLIRYHRGERKLWRVVQVPSLEVGALAGLTATPYSSGGTSREQGISKAGNRRIRAMAVEIAWIWLRYQPNRQLSCWYQQRFGQGNNRMRRIGIVAMARRLLIDLWRYLETGTLPEGAVLKSA